MCDFLLIVIAHAQTYVRAHTHFMVHVKDRFLFLPRVFYHYYHIVLTMTIVVLNESADVGRVGRE